MIGTRYSIRRNYHLAASRCNFCCGFSCCEFGARTKGSNKLFEVHGFKLALTVDLDLPAGLIVAVYTVGAVSEIEDGVRELLGGRIAVFERNDDAVNGNGRDAGTGGAVGFGFGSCERFDIGARPVQPDCGIEDKMVGGGGQNCGARYIQKGRGGLPRVDRGAQGVVTVPAML